MVIENDTLLTSSSAQDKQYFKNLHRGFEKYRTQFSACCTVVLNAEYNVTRFLENDILKHVKVFGHVKY